MVPNNTDAQIKQTEAGLVDDNKNNPSEQSAGTPSAGEDRKRKNVGHDNIDIYIKTLKEKV